VGGAADVEDEAIAIVVTDASPDVVVGAAATVDVELEGSEPAKKYQPRPTSKGTPITTASLRIRRAVTESTIIHSSP
jgi:hypothetical protein